MENGHKIMCGNGIIDDGEQCDVGFIELGDVDTCCQADCLLKPGAQCRCFHVVHVIALLSAAMCLPWLPFEIVLLPDR